MKRCPTCGDVETVRYENIGHCKDQWHCYHVWNQGVCRHCGIFKHTRKERPVEVMPDGKLRPLTRKQEAKWRKRIKTRIA